MTKRLTICTVDTPGRLYVKAQALLDDGKLTVLDRRGKILRDEHDNELVIEAKAEEVSRHITRYGNVTVRNMPGACACGGLRVVDKTKEPT